MINLGSAYGEIQIGVDKAQQNVQSLAQTMRNVGQTMTTTLSLPILGVAAAGLNAAAGFEQSMNQIQVVGGVAADAMSSLNAKALQLGAETSFSAGEAADGMLELAKAGMNADDVMSSIGGTLDLAAAGNLGVGQAAEITANALNAFQLPAEDATKVANLLAAAANSSSVEVTDMAQAFQMSAAVFGSNGVAIDDLATGIAILGNNGLKGSDAGTSLKTMLMRLTAPTDEAAGLMKELGIQVYDAQGNMLEFPAILDNMRQSLFGVHEATVVTGGRTAEQSAELARLQKMYQSTENSIKDYQSGVNGATLSEDKRAKKVEELRAKQAVLMGQINQLAGITGTATTQTVQLTEEQRNQAMATLFGADAIRAANILLGSSAETWTEMSGNVNEAGAATEVAQARMKGLAGAIQYIKGTIESLMIGAFQPFLQSIADMIRGVADAMAAFGRLPQPVINAVMAFLGVLGVAGPVILVMGKIGAVMGALLNPVGLVILAIGALAAAFAADFMGIRTAATQVAGTMGDLWTAMMWVFQGQAENVDWWWDIAEAFGFTGDAAMAVGDALFDLGVRAGNAINVIKTIFQSLRERVTETLTTMIQGFAGLGPQLTRLQEAFGQLAAAVMPILQGLAMVIATVFGVVSVVAINGFLAVMENLPAAIGVVIDTLATVIGGVAAVVSNMVAGVTVLMNGDFAGAWQAAQGIVSGVMTALLGIVGGFVGMVGVAWAALKSTIVGTLETLGFTELAAQIDTIAGKVESGWLQIKDSVTVAVQAFTWDNFVTKMASWEGYISALAWNSYLSVLDWAAYVGAIVWTSFVSALDWVVHVPNLLWAGFVGMLNWAGYVTVLAWDTLVTTLRDWGSYISQLDWTAIVLRMVDWATWIPALVWNAFVTLLDWATIATVLAWEGFIIALDWGVYILQLAWTGFITLLDWATYLPGLIWTGFITLLDWATYLPGLIWTGFITLLDWATYLPGLLWAAFVTLIDWGMYIAQLTWTGFITVLDWAAWLGRLVWNDFVVPLANWTEFIGAFAWESFVSKLKWPLIAQFNWSEWVVKLAWPVITWPGFSTFVKALVWPPILWPGFSAFVKNLVWPGISWPGWASFVPKFSWPSIPEFPGWDALSNLFGGGGGETTKRLTRSGLDWLTTVPASTSRMMPAASTGSATGGGQTINLSIDVASMSSALDIEELAWRIEKRLGRAVSGR